MIRAVVDPGVCISAFISPTGSAPDLIVRAWAAGAFELVMSPKLINELAEVLARPKFAPQSGAGRAAAYVSALAAGALVIADPPNVARHVDGTGVSPRARDRVVAVCGRNAIMMNASRASINPSSC